LALGQSINANSWCMFQNESFEEIVVDNVAHGCRLLLFRLLSYRLIVSDYS
jgi:hypothetical protein